MAFEKRKRHHCTTHGMSHQRPFRIWDTMIQRCQNPKSNSYKNYGARGIRVCDRWMKFEKFWEDMRDGYSPELTLDRIDGDGNYEPGNVKWSTYKEQHNNRRDNVSLMFNGESLRYWQWEDRTGINKNTIRARIHKLGWPISRALTETRHSTGPRRFHGVRD